MLLTHKYTPKNISEIQGQDSAVSALVNFVKDFPKRKRAALIHGPVGSGKTSAVHAIALELDYEIIELNASDARNKDSLLEILGPAMSQRSLFGKGKIILVDEIDGVAGNDDRGGISELATLIETTKFRLGHH